MASKASFRGAILLILLIQLRAIIEASDSTSVTTPSVTESPSSTSMDTTTSSSSTSSSSPNITTTVASSSESMTTVNLTKYNSSEFNMTSKISCRSYNCNSSSCYNMFMSLSPTPCDPNISFCELKKIDSMRYSVNCSISCNTTSDRCMNQTQTDCTAECCNTTNCLNSTIFSMAMSISTTPASGSTTQAATTKATTSIATTPKNGKKCNKLKCSGEKCYQTETKMLVDCLVGQDFCQLKKVVSVTVITWEAGCSGNCTGDKWCSSTTTDCTQECCNATAASCLKLDGSVNMPGSSSVGLHPSLVLVASWLLVWVTNSLCLVG